uniref:Thioredoxin n=1 Tax=Parastrongyloides trichosuri TaxID=131310 RepID=A0A0N4Z2Z9_PARTI
MNLHHLKEKKELDELVEKSKGKLIVIDFFATWCGPCKFAAPQFEKLSKHYTNVVFVKIDVEEADELATFYNIQAMPTFIFLKDGQIIKTMQGFDADELKTTIDNYHKN